MTTSLSGLGGIGSPNTVGNETPDWEFPYGKDRVSQEVQKYFFRADAGPTGMNAAEKPSAAAVEEFRRLVNTGIIRPKNDAAKAISRAQGGLRAGDETLLGPIINSMPEGLTPEYWAVVIQKAQQAANEQIAIMNATGYFDGKSTLDRERIEAEIKDNIANTEIKRRLADETIRKDDMDDAFNRDKLAQDMRQNIIAQFGYDPGPQGAAGLMSGNKSAGVAGADGVQPMPGSQGTPDPNAPAALQQSAQQEGAQRQSAQAAGPDQAKAQAAQALQTNPEYRQLEAQINDPNTPPEQREALVAQAQAMQQQAEQSAAAAPGGAPGVAGQYPQVGTPGAAGGAPRPNMTTAVGSEIGRQWVDGQGWVQTLGGRAADLSQQQQAFAQQQAQANLAANPRNYIEAQMLGNSRGAMGGMAPNNQVNPTTGMPGQFPGGMQQPGQMQWPMQPGQLPGGMPGQREPWMNGGMMQPQPGQMPGADGMASISPVNPATGMRFDENTGQYTSQPMPTAEQNYAGRMALMGGLPQGMQAMPEGGLQNAMRGQMDQYKAAQLGQFQAPGMAGMGMTGMRQQPMAQPLQAGQPGQMGMPGAMPQMPGQMPGGQQWGQQNQLKIGAFSQALNQNRVVPKSGGMGQQGASMSQADLINQTNPQKWRAQDFMRGNDSEKQQALGTASAAGISDADTQSMMAKSLPTFKAPGAGAMV